VKNKDRTYLYGVKGLPISVGRPAGVARGRVKKIIELELTTISMRKVDLHFGDYHSKLVHFEAQKNYFLC
jgi:hypothetical protein